MITYFQDYNTDKILSSSDMDFIPNVEERVNIDDIQYIVVERTFDINHRRPICTIYVKEE